MTTPQMSSDEIEFLNQGRRMAKLAADPIFKEFQEILKAQIETREKSLEIPAHSTEVWVAQETVKGALGALRLAHDLVPTIVTEAQRLASENEVEFERETPAGD